MCPMQQHKKRKARVSFGDGGELLIDLRAKDWDEACDVIVFNRNDPPDGYRLQSAAIKQRARRGGRAVNIRLEFWHIDSRVIPMSFEDAVDLFTTESAPPARESALS